MNKPFAWSYSKLKNYETCAKRYYHVDLLRDVKEEESEALLWGNQVHEALAKRVGPKQTPLPAGHTQFEPWAERILTGGGNILVEQKLAINADFGPCQSFFAKDAWYRGVADVIKIHGDVALVVDWKTGRILEDAVQLGLMAACVFSHHKDVQKIRTEFVWLKEGDGISTREDFTRQSIVELWRSLWPRIGALKQAHEQTNFPPNPGRLCRNWCPVSKCPHHGE